MKQIANLDGLNNFKRKLLNINKNLSNFSQQILQKICQQGVSYAQSIYPSSENINVKYEILGDNSAKIIANGKKIAYLEFGTGENGRNTYEGELPTETISFYSTRLQQNVTLNGWIYSYAHEIDQNQKLWGGAPSQAQMWKTSQYLRQILPQIIKEVDIG
jgi:hypothetical protein